MTALSVWPFDTHEGAAHDEKLLEAADRDHLVKMLGHGVVSWGCDDQEPTMRDKETWRGTGCGRPSGPDGRHGDHPRARPRYHPPEVHSRQFPPFVVPQEDDLDRLGERMQGVH
jgi:hypothetical protein